MQTEHALHRTGHHISTDQIVTIEKVGVLETWLVGEIADAKRLKALAAAQMAQALHPTGRDYRIYVADVRNAAAMAWAKDEVTRRRKDEILFVVDEEATG